MKGLIRNRLVLIGAGNMGGAMLDGWLDKGLEADKIAVFDPKPNAGAANLIRERNLLHNPLPSMCNGADLVVIAVKPQEVAAGALDDYAELFAVADAAVSIVAGLPIATCRRRFGDRIALARCMPNVAAQVGRSVSVCCLDDKKAEAPETGAPEGLKDLIDELFQAIGQTMWIDDESLFDAATAVFGSGPAYVFLLIECLAEAARRHGLDPDLAERMARETVGGAGELARRSMSEPRRLRENVASPQGVTEAALNVLMKDDRMMNAFIEAIDAGAARSRRLSAS